MTQAHFAVNATAAENEQQSNIISLAETVTFVDKARDKYDIWNWSFSYGRFSTSLRVWGKQKLTTNNNY